MQTTAYKVLTMHNDRHYTTTCRFFVIDVHAKRLKRTPCNVNRPPQTANINLQNEKTRLSFVDFQTEKQITWCSHSSSFAEKITKVFELLFASFRLFFLHNVLSAALRFLLCLHYTLLTRYFMWLTGCIGCEGKLLLSRYRKT